MRITIEHGAARRTIAGPFNLAGSNDDLRRVAESILTQLEKNNSAGYVQVTDLQPPLGDAKAVPWSQG